MDVFHAHYVLQELARKVLYQLPEHWVQACAPVINKGLVIKYGEWGATKWENCGFETVFALRFLGGVKLDLPPSSSFYPHSPLPMINDWVLSVHYPDVSHVNFPLWYSRSLNKR